MAYFSQYYDILVGKPVRRIERLKVIRFAVGRLLPQSVGGFTVA